VNYLSSVFEVQKCNFWLCRWCKKKFWNLTFLDIQIPMFKTPKYCKYLKIQQILTNTTHVLCGISCIWKFVILYLFLDCVLLFMFHQCMYSDLDQCTKSFLILTYKFCLKPYIDKSLSLIKFTIIMCESVLDMKDCNGEVLT
jgi:hypothetical protein